MSDLRACWSRLGFHYGGEMAASPPQLEELLLASLGEVREDPRLFLGVATWLQSYGFLLDGHHLVKLRGKISGEHSALLGALLTASSNPHLKGLLGSCEPLGEEEILFRVMEEREVLRERVQTGALPEIRRWGFLVEDLTLKPDALRPSSWVLRQNPELKIRALLGANLRGSVVHHLIEAGRGLSISALAREIRRPYPSVHAAVQALVSVGMLEREEKGRSVLVSVPRDVAAWLMGYPAALAPRVRRELAA